MNVRRARCPRSLVFWSAAALLVLSTGCEDKSSASADPAPGAAPAPEVAEAPNEADPAETDPVEEGAAPAESDAADEGDQRPEVEGKTAANQPADPPSPKKPPAPPEAKADDKPKGPLVGERSQLTASAAADAGYKCNDAYPHKFITGGGTNVSYPEPKPRGSCAGKKGIAVSIPYVPTAAGPGTVSGELRYGICDEAGTNCVVKKKQVSLAFNAAAK